MDMCRFTGLDDVEYKKVAAALQRMTKAISRQPRDEGFQSLSEEQRRILLESLRFDQIDARRLTIRKAHAKTCHWLLHCSVYVNWLDPSKVAEHHGFLWIKGKPGAGKSTLLKFALDNARKTIKDKTLISFFFNARGDELEKSTIGMYRSLLLQLLERLPALQCVFDSLGLVGLDSGGHQWSIEALKALFEQAVQSLGPSPVACFIDALDECEESQVRDMVSFFEHIGELAVSEGLRFHVCFSSRHYPHITINRGYGLDLNYDDGHKQDIVCYLDSKLNVGGSKLAEQIRIEIQDKAAGIFMWVVLVVEILNREFDGGRLYALRKRLREIPGDLYKLFHDILTRDYLNTDELLLCIRWVLHARHPLKPEQLYFAIVSGSAPDTLSSWDPNEITLPTIDRFILNSSKGLAEITKSERPTVQFIHESVRDFLLKEDGLRRIWPDLGPNVEGESHEWLKQCCLKYMNCDPVAKLEVTAPLPKASSIEAEHLREATDKELPFLQYAVQNVLYHAEAADIGGIGQSEFIRSFQHTTWINLHNLFETHQLRRYKSPSLLYVLAENNTPALIKLHPSSRFCLQVEDELYGTPIFAALATGSDEAALAFLEILLRMQPPDSPLHDLCKQYFEDKFKCAEFDLEFSFSKEERLYGSAAFAHEGIFALICASNDYDTEMRLGRQRKTALAAAAWKGYETVVKLLLEKGADIESWDDRTGRTPLLLA
jgi:hypothetical protein